MQQSTPSRYDFLTMEARLAAARLLASREYPRVEQLLANDVHLSNEDASAE
jgi:hypothetical protein